MRTQNLHEKRIYINNIFGTSSAHLPATTGRVRTTNERLRLSVHGWALGGVGNMFEQLEINSYK